MGHDVRDEQIAGLSVVGLQFSSILAGRGAIQVERKQITVLSLVVSEKLLQQLSAWS